MKELVRIGFIDRRVDPHDGRGVRLYPTPRAASNLRILRKEWARQVADALGDADVLGDLDELENGDAPGNADAQKGAVDVRSSVALLERLTAGLVASRQRQR